LFVLGYFDNKDLCHLAVSPRGINCYLLGQCMANSNGIFKHGSSHYLRVVLPKTHQLINAYKSGKVIVSLGACSYREALTAAAIKRAQILEADEKIGH
jgi:hypothetical protein